MDEHKTTQLLAKQLESTMATCRRIEAMARLIAAERMKLRKTWDGSGLPDDLWKQCMPEARAVYLLISRNDLRRRNAA